MKILDMKVKMSKYEKYEFYAFAMLSSPIYITGFISYYPTKWIVNAIKGLPIHTPYMSRQLQDCSPSKLREEMNTIVAFGPFSLVIMLVEIIYKSIKCITNIVLSCKSYFLCLKK